MHLQRLLHQTALITLIGILTREFSHALRDVHVLVPHAVRRGAKVTLQCFYDIEDDSLYSVKWYKGRREFYRYTPKENPPMKIFQFPGVRVERHASNESQLVLDSATMASAGKYSCEVSADAPSFHTLIAAGELEVVEIPHNPPIITGLRQRYRIGDILRGNCTSRHSRPAANLTWTVNNEEINPSHVRHYKVLRDLRNEMETVMLGLYFMVTERHFEDGKMKLRCTAQIHDVYWKSTERVVHEGNLHRKYASTHGVNMVQPDELYDQYALHDNEIQHKQHNYLTQLQDFLWHFMPTSNSNNEDTASPWGNSGTAHTPRVTRLLIILVLLWSCRALTTLLTSSSSGIVGTAKFSQTKRNRSAELCEGDTSVEACRPVRHSTAEA